MITETQQSRIWFLAALVLAAMMLGPGESFAQTGGYITTADVQLRKGPGTNYEVITTIPRDIQVNVVGKEGNWLRIESKHGGKPGYISAQYARPAGPQSSAQAAPLSVGGAYRTMRETDLRERPALNSKVIAKLPAGIKINVVRSEGDWLRVESKHGGKPGYIEKQTAERWRDR